jgi:hypothetical protein
MAKAMDPLSLVEAFGRPDTNRATYEKRREDNNKRGTSAWKK